MVVHLTDSQTSFTAFVCSGQGPTGCLESVAPALERAAAVPWTSMAYAIGGLSQAIWQSQWPVALPERRRRHQGDRHPEACRVRAGSSTPVGGLESLWTLQMQPDAGLRDQFRSPLQNRDSPLTNQADSSASVGKDTAWRELLLMMLLVELQSVSLDP